VPNGDDPAPSVDGIAARLDADFAAWRASLSFGEVAELRLYQSTGYLTLNTFLRNEQTGYDDEALARIDSRIETIDAGISKGRVASPLRVYRGLRDPEAVFGTDDLQTLIGEFTAEPAYLSTSLDPVVAVGMTITAASPLLIVLDVPAGQEAAWLGLAGDPKRRREFELLLPRRTRIKIEGTGTYSGTQSLEGSVVV